jgi:glycerophosphoryl diester phosphodiesterase
MSFMKKCVIGVLILMSVGLLTFMMNEPTQQRLPEEAYAWVKKDYFYAIAHRLGPAKHTGENRIATFDLAYAQGFRFFEVDLMLTSDQQLICYHGNSHDEIISYAAYAQTSKAQGREPCDMDDLVQLAVAHPEIYFILDVKNEFEPAYQLIKEKVRAADVGYSFIPQIYSIEQSSFVREGNVFSVELYTAYRLPAAASNQSIFEQARAMAIPVVTLSLDRLSHQHSPLPRDLLIFTHPVNDFEQAASLKKQGVSGIYTSDLTPGQLSTISGR